MNIPIRPLLVVGGLLAFSLLVFERAQAGGGHYYPPVADPVVKEECGSCHLAFAPAMLPARSWQRMMTDLGNHFGDDASLDPDTAARITRYLVANAGDTGGQRYSRKLMAGISADAAPLRITELPKWKREHREVPDWEWRHKEVKSPANCLACHTDADRGYYYE